MGRRLGRPALRSEQVQEALAPAAAVYNRRAAGMAAWWWVSTRFLPRLRMG
ncbi:hypothetical protein AB0D11_47450 [Streptomyces monashensis]|uniref:hypothetical protein n=1 Tax=Streptomyces monashensis TaxID=1678012 RepID=UPI0033D73EA6